MPLAVLSTGDAYLATIPAMRRSYMVHSVEVCATSEALTAVLREAAVLRDLSHSSLLHVFAVVTDQPCGEVGLLSELAAASLASVLASPPLQLSWQNGLLSIATDVAAGLAHLHARKLHHGRLFLFNVMLTASWRAKLSEYALDAYLSASHGGLGTSGGYDLLPSSHGEHGGQIEASAVLYLPPEKSSGKMAIAQRRRLDASIAAAEQRRGSTASKKRRSSLTLARKTAASRKESSGDLQGETVRGSQVEEGHTAVEEGNVESSTWQAALAEPSCGSSCGSCCSDRSHADVDLELAMEEAERAERAADAWAFGCLLCSLARHHRKAKEEEREQRSQERDAHMEQAREKHHLAGGDGGGAPGSSGSTGDLFFPFAVGERVRHVTRGDGTVVELLEDGRTKVEFDNGGEHRYHPKSMHKLISLSLADVDGGDIDADAHATRSGASEAGGIGRLAALREKSRAAASCSSPCNNARESAMRSCSDRFSTASASSTSHPKNARKRRAQYNHHLEGWDYDEAIHVKAGPGRTTEHASARAKLRSAEAAALVAQRAATQWRQTALNAAAHRRASCFGDADCSSTAFPSSGASSPPVSPPPSPPSLAAAEGAAETETKQQQQPAAASPAPARASVFGAAATPRAKRCGTPRMHMPMHVGTPRMCSRRGRAKAAAAAVARLHEHHGLGAISEGEGGTDGQLAGDEGGSAHSRRYRRSAAPPPPAASPYMLMLRVCQGRVSPLDGLTSSCMPRPLLHLASLCCSLQPAARPQMHAMLEQLHSDILRAVDPTGIEKLRPTAPLLGWREAAEAVLPPCSETAAATSPASPAAAAVGKAGVLEDSADAGGSGGSGGDLFDLLAFCKMVGGEMSVVSEAAAAPDNSTAPAHDRDADDAAAEVGTAPPAAPPQTLLAGCVPHERPAALPSAPRLPMRGGPDDGRMSRRAAQKVAMATSETLLVA